MRCFTLMEKCLKETLRKSNHYCLTMNEQGGIDNRMREKIGVIKILNEFLSFNGFPSSKAMLWFDKRRKHLTRQKM